MASNKLYVEYQIQPAEGELKDVVRFQVVATLSRGDSRWTSRPVALGASSESEAVEEAAKKMQDWIDTLLGL